MEKILIVVVAGLLATGAFADGHAPSPMVIAESQSVANGMVSAEKVVAAENGWMVVHRTGADKKPGPVVGYAPLRMGENIDVAAILTEDVSPGDLLMLMVHSEAGGTQRGRFEYTLGAKEDGPIKIDGKLVMAVISAN
jgi:hypothetical protein